MMPSRTARQVALLTVLSCLPALAFGQAPPTPAAQAAAQAAATAAASPLEAARDRLRRKDFAGALALFGTAAQGGNAEAQYQYAQMLRNAQGTTAGADVKGACTWFEKAAAQGHARAALALAQLVEETKCTSTMSAADWRARAAKGGATPPPSTATITRDDPAVRKDLAFRAARDGDASALAAALRADAALGTAKDTAGRTLLHYAAESAKPAAIDALLAARVPVDAQDTQHYTPLSLAALAGCAECVRSLVAAKASPDIADHDGNTPLLIAVGAAKAPVVELLLAAGASTQHRNKAGDDAKALAARGSDTAVRALFGLPAGNPRNSGDAPGVAKTGVYAGWSALQVAAEKGDFEAARKALASGAPVDGKTPDGWTPLSLAARRGDGKLVDLLLKAGAKPGLAVTDRWTPFTLAVRGHHLDAIRLLIAAGVDVNTPAPNGMRPIVEATNDDALLVAVLAGRPALDGRDVKGATALVAAAANGKGTAVRALLGVGADTRAVDNRGRTAAWYAASRGDLDILDALLKANARALVALAATDGSTPLHAAAGAGRDAAVARLLSAGADVAAVTKTGNSSLHVASAAGQVPVIQRLVAARAKVDSKNARQDTPLFVAVRARQLGAVRALLAAGADVRLRNADGQTAAEVATAAGFTELLPLLKR